MVEINSNPLNLTILNFNRRQYFQFLCHKAIVLQHEVRLMYKWIYSISKTVKLQIFMRLYSVLFMYMHMLIHILFLYDIKYKLSSLHSRMNHLINFWIWVNVRSWKNTHSNVLKITVPSKRCTTTVI